MKNKSGLAFFKGKRILITGGLGFIGSNLAIRLLKLGAKVTLVDSMIPQHGGNLFNIKDIKRKINLDYSDLRDSKAISSLVKDKKIIFNLAGQVSHLDSMIDPFTDLKINAFSQLSLLEACRKHNPKVKIVFTSTRQVYGKPEYLPVDERHPLSPTDINGVNNLAGEWYHTIYNNVYGIRAVVLRLTNTFGPRQLIRHNKQGFIGWFIRQAVEKKKVLIYGDGSQLRDPNYVDDVVEAIMLSARDDSLNGKIFNLGNHPAISLKDIVQMLIKICGFGSYRMVRFPKDKIKIDIGNYYADFSKFRDATGWEPRIPYEEGFRKTLAYYKKYLKYYL